MGQENVGLELRKRMLGASVAGELVTRDLLLPDACVRAWKAGRLRQVRLLARGVRQVIAPVSADKALWRVLVEVETGGHVPTFIESPAGGVGSRVFVREAYPSGSQDLAARFMALVHDVRMEPLQRMSKLDAVLAGVEGPVDGEYRIGAVSAAASELQAYKVWWNSQHEEDQWESDPVVFVVVLEPLSENGAGEVAEQ
jgi:hypothetical protein